MRKEELEQHRQVSLRLFDIVCSEYEDDLSIDLQTLHDNIKKNKFLLAIMGEVKAGKSTFINALLGEEVLPSDIRQATSAIVEIFKADKKFIKAIYANGKEEEMEDDLDTPDIDEAVEYLKKIASVQEEYRNLPIVQLNNFIIDKLENNGPNVLITNDEIDEFIENTELENLKKLPKEEFERQVKEYIKIHKDGSKIAKVVEVGYPHGFEFDQFRLVDTPGIGAVGGIEEQTRSFVNKADGVIYLHNGSAESRPLENAYKNELTDKIKKNMYLILTHRSKHILEDIEIKTEEISEIYPKIKKEQIFSVDSLTELYLKKIKGKSMDEIEGLMDNDSHAEDLFAKAARKSKGNLADFIDYLEEQSNFRSAKKSIVEFSENALSIQLTNFVEEIKKHFIELQDATSEKIKACKNKFKDPQGFAKKIHQIREEMKKYELDLNRFIEEIGDEFNVNVNGSKSQTKLEEIFNKFETEINEKSHADFKHIDNIKTYTEKIANDFLDTYEFFIKDMTNEINTKISEFNVEQEEKIKLNIPKIVMSKIWQKSKKDSTETKQKEVDQKGAWGFCKRVFTFGICGKETKNYTEVNKEKLWENIRSQILNLIFKERKNISDSINIFIDSATKKYKKEIKKKMEDRKSFFLNLKNEKKSNEEFQKKIDSLNKQLCDFNENINKCNELLGELSC